MALLNNMLGQWSANRALVYQLTDYWALGTGSESYGIGPGGDFDLPARPNRVEKAFLRYGGSTTAPTPKVFVADVSSPDSTDVVAPATANANLLDFPLTLLGSYEEYVDIGLKGQASFPAIAYYNPSYPVGTLFVWPVASSAFELHILARTPLGGFASPNVQVVLPPEYYEAIHYNLVVRLAAAYGLEPPRLAATLAATGLQTIRSANAQVSKLRMPTSLMPFSSRGWVGQGLGLATGFGTMPTGISGPTVGGGTTGDIVGTPYTLSNGQVLTDSSGNPLRMANPYTAPPIFIVGVTPLDSGAVWAP